MRWYIIGVVAVQQRCICQRIHVHGDYRLWASSKIQVHSRVYAISNYRFYGEQQWVICVQSNITAIDAVCYGASDAAYILYMCLMIIGIVAEKATRNVCVHICKWILLIMWSSAIDTYGMTYMRLATVDIVTNSNRTRAYAHICNEGFGYHSWAP